MNQLSLLDMNPFNQLVLLLSIILLPKGDPQIGVYREKIKYHLKNCDTCQFCNKYLREESKEIKDIDCYYECFMKCYQEASILDNSSIRMIYSDLFRIFYKTHQDIKTINCSFRFGVSLLVKKYLQRNKYPAVMNLMLIYQKHFETHDEDCTQVINLIKIYIFLVSNLKKIVKRISSYVLDNNITPKSFLQLGHEIHLLKKHNQKDFLMNKTHTGDFCMSIITFVFEEITNLPINKERGMFKEEISLYEDLLVYQYTNSNNIILVYNPNNKTIIIQKAGMNMFELIGSDLISLFPKELRPEGERLFHESLNTTDNLKEFEFIIQMKNGQYAELNIKYNLLYVNLNEDFYINGEYQLYFNDIVISRCQKDKVNSPEVLYDKTINIPSGLRKKQSSQLLLSDINFKRATNDNMVLISQLSNNHIKLKYQVHTEYYKYNVYVQVNQKKNKNTTKNHNSIINNTIYETQVGNKSIIYKIGDTASLCNSGSSVCSALSLSGREQSQLSLNIMNKYKQYQSRFVKTIKITLGFCIFIIIFSIVSLVIELNSNTRLLDSYNVYTQLRAVNRLFYNTINSILAVICIGNANAPNCVNYYMKYNQKYDLENEIEYPTVEYSLYENPLKVADFGSGLSKLKTLMYTLDDDKASTIFYHEFQYTYLSVKEDNITVKNTNTSFVNALEILFNGLLVIIENGKYSTDPVYIISLENYNFSNIYDKKNLKDWQIEYYNLVINYQKYLDNWVNIQISLSDNTNYQLTFLSQMVIICLNISNILHVGLVILVFFFIYSFTNLFILNMNKLMIKIQKEDYIKFFIQKYTNLDTLTNFFEKNPVTLIKEINKFSSDYKKNSKTPKTNIRDHYDTNIQLVNYFPYKDYYGIVSIFYTEIIFILIYYITIFIIFLVIWCYNVNSILEVFNIITDNTVCSCSGYNVFALAQLMILVNQTEKDLSKRMNHTGDDYLIAESMRSLEVIVRLEVKRQEVSSLMKTTNDFIDLDCETFYTEIKDIRFEEIDKKHPTKGFRSKYPSFCKTFNIMHFKNDLVFYKTVFYSIHKIVNLITSFKYEDLIGYLEQGDIFYLSDLQFLLYRPFRSWFNNIVYSDAINNSINLEKTILFSILGISIASEICIFVFLYIYLFKRLSKMNEILIGVKNVFKIIK